MSFTVPSQEEPKDGVIEIPVKRKRGRPRKCSIPVAASSEDSDDDIPLASRLKVQTVLKQEVTSSQELSDSAEEYPDFEPNNSDEEVDAMQFKLPTPAMVKVEAKDPDFEYQDASLFVKEEGSNPEIYCTEKDKLLDVLLSTEPLGNFKVERGTGILDEIAAVPMAKRNETEQMEEDVLALRETEADSAEDDDIYERQSRTNRINRSRCFKLCSLNCRS